MMTDKKKDTELTISTQATALFDDVVKNLKSTLPSKKDVETKLKNGLKAYSKTMQTITKDIVENFIAYKRNDYSNTKVENEEIFELNLLANKEALEMYAIKITEEEVLAIKTFLEKIATSAIPILSEAAKALVKIVLGV